jgi:DNA repair exonuclease SbcCD ATPase subunit
LIRANIPLRIVAVAIFAARCFAQQPDISVLQRDVEQKTAAWARLTALSKYLEASAAVSHADAEAMSQAVAAHQRSLREIAANAAEAEQERIAIDAQIADLAESIKRRASLGEAQKILADIAAMLKDRVAGAQQETDRNAVLGQTLAALQVAYEQRERAVQADIAALAVETARWNDFYTARSARAHIECSITNEGPARPLRKKQ